MIIKTYKPNNFEEHSQLLKDMISQQYEYDYLFRTLPGKIMKSKNTDGCPLYSIIMRIINLVSPKERLLQYDLLYNISGNNYINLEIPVMNLGYHAFAIIHIKKEANQIFKQYPYLQSDEKFLIWSMIYKAYLLLDNNSFNGKYYSINFSKNYIPIFIKLVQLNSFDLNDQDLLFMAASQIINQNYMKNYSQQNAMKHFNLALVYFKLFFKKVFPAQFRILMNFMISFDNLIIKGFLNSFSDVFDTINFNIYTDFKNILFLIFSS